MLTKEQHEKVESRLKEMLIGQLHMRWPKAYAYLPPGGSRIHCAHPLPGADQDAFDLFVLGYQQAINGVMRLLGSGEDDLERLVVIAMAENSVFQAGSAPTGGVSKHNGVGKRRVFRPPSEARMKAELLFKGGGDE